MTDKVELINETNGHPKVVDLVLAEIMLKQTAKFKPRGLKGWKLKEDSIYVFKDGALVLKAKPKEETKTKASLN